MRILVYFYDFHDPVKKRASIRGAKSELLIGATLFLRAYDPVKKRASIRGAKSGLLIGATLFLRALSGGTR